MKLGQWLDPIVSKLNLPESWVKPVVAMALGFKEDNKWKLGWIAVGNDPKQEQSLFYNGVFFVRIAFPFFIGVGVRWSGATDKRAFLQTYAGWKLNGDFSIVFRIQSDGSAASGYTGPNTGQAYGWNAGTK